ncbi:TD and POZ domain-containing protein 2-like [Paramacrobiotus metropolitanus]|uniref:TD and POZ domain-containing protein 2-like n=1 Tax=Paramacrobiotus metropolitanus TaxID=2943436 RepID=UPI0024464809|nr:TD and POZ domain-containing protein 2-like [Paramacrobiotus metropolitanus]
MAVSRSGNRIVVKDRAHRESVQLTLECAFHNFTSYMKTSLYIYSRGATLAELGFPNMGGRWRIAILPCRKNATDNENYVCVYLYLCEVDLLSTEPYSGTGTLNVSGHISAATGSAKNISVGESLDIPEIEFCYDRTNFGSETLINHRQLLGANGEAGLIQDDVVTIRIDVSMYRSKPSEPEVVRVPEVAPPATVCPLEFHRRQMQQMQQNNFTDFRLRSNDDREFAVHRFLLAAHSPVFLAMLTHYSQEKVQSYCDLADTDGESVEILLDYLYGCTSDRITGANVEKTLIMADKYQIMDLRAVCEGKMAGDVDVNNAMHRFHLASQRGLQVLKAAALDVIAQNMRVVGKDNELKAVIKSDPDLFEIIMHYCAK